MSQVKLTRRDPVKQGVLAVRDPTETAMHGLWGGHHSRATSQSNCLHSKADPQDGEPHIFSQKPQTYSCKQQGASDKYIGGAC